MAIMPTIDALLQAAQRIPDRELKEELLGKITEVQRELAAREGQLDALRTQLNGNVPRYVPSAGIMYDPPV